MSRWLKAARRSAQAGSGCADETGAMRLFEVAPCERQQMRLTVIGTLAAGVLLLSACTEAAPSAAPAATPSTPAWALFEGPPGLEAEAEQRGPGRPPPPLRRHPPVRPHGRCSRARRVWRSKQNRGHGQR